MLELGQRRKHAGERTSIKIAPARLAAGRDEPGSATGIFSEQAAPLAARKLGSRTREPARKLGLGAREPTCTGRASTVSGRTRGKARECVPQ